MTPDQVLEWLAKWGTDWVSAQTANSTFPVAVRHGARDAGILIRHVDGMRVTYKLTDKALEILNGKTDEQDLSTQVKQEA